MLQRGRHVLNEARHVIINVANEAAGPWFRGLHCGRLGSTAPHFRTNQADTFLAGYSTVARFQLTEDVKRQLHESVSQLDALVQQLNDAGSLSSSRRQNLQRDVNRLQNTAAQLSEYDHLDREVQSMYSVLYSLWKCANVNAPNFRPAAD